MGRKEKLPVEIVQASLYIFKTPISDSERLAVSLTVEDFCGENPIDHAWQDLFPQASHTHLIQATRHFLINLLQVSDVFSYEYEEQELVIAPALSQSHLLLELFEKTDHPITPEHLKILENNPDQSPIYRPVKALVDVFTGDIALVQDSLLKESLLNLLEPLDQILPSTDLDEETQMQLLATISQLNFPELEALISESKKSTTPKNQNDRHPYHQTINLLQRFLHLDYWQAEKITFQLMSAMQKIL